jgi:hypothetical protein
MLSYLILNFLFLLISFFFSVWMDFFGLEPPWRELKNRPHEGALFLFSSTAPDENRDPGILPVTRDPFF